MPVQRWRDSLLGARSVRSWIDGPFEDLEKEMKDMMVNMGSKEVKPPPSQYMQQAAQGLGNVSSAGNAEGRNAKYEYLRRLGFEFGVAEGYALPFEYIDVMVSKPTGKVVVFFFGPDGKPGYFEEEPKGFPSEALLAKLQLIRTT